MTRGLSREAAGVLTPLQKVLLAGGLVVAVTVSLAVALQLESGLLRWVKTGSAALLFVAALVLPRHHRVLGWLVAAFGMSTLADAFLTRLIVPPGGLGRLVGIGLFAVTYVLLTVAFWRRPLGGAPLRATLGFAALYALVAGGIAVFLWPRLGGAMTIAVPAFATVISVMAWSAALTRWRGFYTPEVGRLFAIGAAFIVANDAAVAFVMFDPPPAAWQVGVDVWIRFTYFLGWLLLLLGLVDPAPTRPAPVDRVAAPRLR